MELPAQDALPFIGDGLPVADASALARTRSRKRIRSTASSWTPDEDALLAQLVDDSPNWTQISSHFPGRTNKQVVAHWRKVADPAIVRGSWSCQEDQTVIAWVAAHGATQWATLALQLPGRIPRQCRERWVNQLDPAIKRESWTPEEDHVIVAAVQQIGSKWADIAKLLDGRTDNAVKNRWNSSLKRRNIEVDPGLIDQYLRQSHVVMRPPPEPVMPTFGGGGDPKGGDDPLLPGSGQ
jgi:myb proto-oncogene protein/myb-related protein